jgi:FkbM family methyltransferase
VTITARTVLRITTVLAVIVAVALGSAYFGAKVGREYERNRLCCDMPPARGLQRAVKQVLGRATSYSQIGQDKWVLETVYPGLRNGFFLDVGSADGTLHSNTRALEERGWHGICVDPFPTNMQGRTCEMLREVVFSEPGKPMRFQAAGELGGITDTLGVWKDAALQGRSVTLTTTTLDDILARRSIPAFIHYISLDIEGAELEALKGFPFGKYRVGALSVEHNSEEPKRTEIQRLLASHGYRRVHSWYQDDFYLPAK